MNLSRYFSILLVFVSLTGSIKAQQNNSMYYMESVPQAVQLNPAIQPKCGFFLGLFSVEMNAGNTATGIDDILINDPKNNGMKWFMNDGAARKNFLTKFKNNDVVYGDARVDYPSLGFRISKSYFTFNVSTRVETRNYIPYGLADLVINGNLETITTTGDPDYRNIDLSGLGANMTAFNEYAIGFSHQFTDKLTLGIRAKALFGIADVTTNSSDVRMQGSGDSYITRSKIDLNTSVPNLKVYEGADGNVDSLVFKDIEGFDRNIFLNTKNMGLGFDLGAVYKINEKINVSASILDLGYIRWKNNLNNFKQNATYDFRGATFSFNDSVDIAEALLDTLKNHFTYSSHSDPYTTGLHAKVYAGVFFRPVKLVGFGFLTRQQFIQKKLNSQYTLSLNLYPANAFNLTLSYTIADHMYDNFGFGVAFKLLPFQVYIMSERIPLYWNKNIGKEGIPYIPAYAKNMNLRVGMNLAFGYKHKEKKARKDKPLVE